MWLFINEGQKLQQTTTQALENCSFTFLFDSRTLIATLRHIALTTQTAMPCAPRSYLASGDHDRWPGPRPTRPPPLHLQFSSNFTIEISVRVSQKNDCQLIRFRFICEEINLGERAKKKKRSAFESEYLLSGSSGTSKNRVTGYSMYSFQP